MWTKNTGTKMVLTGAMEPPMRYRSFCLPKWRAMASSTRVGREGPDDVGEAGQLGEGRHQKQ